MRRALTPGTAILLVCLTVGCDGNPFAPAFQPVSYIAIEAGGGHSCGLAIEGELYCWGRGGEGQLGDGAFRRSADPVRVAGAGGPYTALTLGKHHGCAVAHDGRARCWGWNGAGQLGVGSTTDSGTPVDVAGDLTFAHLAAGLHYTCGLTVDGEAWCWGENARGQLGDGGSARSTSPVRVAGGLTFTAITAGGYHTCGLTVDGEAYCWGLNDLGQLGVGDVARRTKPTPVSGGHRFGRITAGERHTCAIADLGLAFCWGRGRHGELGNGYVLTPFDPPLTVPIPMHQIRHDGQIVFREIDAGQNFTCATDHRLRAWCWGLGFDGQLGGNALGVEPFARQVFATLDVRFTGISTGHGTHVCASTDSFGAYCWGTSPEGGLGPVTTFSAQPVRIPGPR